MTVREVLSAYPELKVVRGEFGTAQTWIIPAAGQRRGDPRLEGVSGVFLAFLNDRVYSVEVHYGDKNPWRSMDEFTAAVSGTMGLNGPWESEGAVRSLICDGFRLLVIPPDIIPTLYLIDTRAEKALAVLKEGPMGHRDSAPAPPHPGLGSTEPARN